jgi:uncharacterized protein YbjT (DUF2867 family)
VIVKIVILGASTPLGKCFVAEFAARGDTPVALVRKAGQIASLRELGAEPVLADTSRPTGPMLSAIAAAVGGADAFVLAAGTTVDGGQPGEGTGRLSAAQLFSGLAERVGVRRYLMISNWYGADDQPWPEAQKTEYRTAKVAAEDDVRGRDLDWTILRTARLVDAPGGGGVRLTVDAGSAAPAGSISRADVAAVGLALLGHLAGNRTVLAVTAGPEPVDSAVARLPGRAGCL